LQQHIMNSHWVMVTSIAFSPSRIYAVSGSSDCTVRLWDIATGSQQHVMKGHTDTVRIVAFSPDGASIVSGSSDDSVRIWDTATGSQQFIMGERSNPVCCITFSSDSKYVVAGLDDRTVRLRHCDILQQHAIVVPVTAVAFSPDGRSVVSGLRDGAVHVWDITTGIQQRHVMESHTTEVVSVAFSSSSQLIASVSVDRTVQVWDAATGTVNHTLRGNFQDVPTSPILSVPHGNLNLHNQLVRAWDPVTCTYHQVLRTRPRGAGVISFSLDSRSVLLSNIEGTLVWDAVTGRQLGSSARAANKYATAPPPPTRMSNDHPIFQLDQTGWIWRSGARDVLRRLCWLPVERRPSPNYDQAWACYGQQLCIGAPSGLLTILDCSHVAYPP
jgi:WD40 repeat protein